MTTLVRVWDLWARPQSHLHSVFHVSEKLLPLHAPSPVGTARQNKMESEQTSESLWDRWMRLTKATIRTDFSPSHQPLFPAGGRKDHFCSSMCKWATGLAQYANRIPRARPRGVEAEKKESRRNKRVRSSVRASGMTILIKRRGAEVSPVTHTYKDRETLVISQRLAEEELAGNDRAKVLRERESILKGDNYKATDVIAFT